MKKPKQKYDNLYYKMWAFLRQIRIWYISTRYPIYLENRIKQRTGKCPPSCSCCTFLECEYFDKDRPGCKRQNNKPQECYDFPYDRFDQMLYKRSNPDAKCCFRWDEKKR